MLSISVVILRILFVASLAVAFLAPRVVDGSVGWRRAGILVALLAAVLLLGARFGIRATAPGKLPASSG